MREEPYNAEIYDLFTNFGDTDFYLDMVQSRWNVLELGCGTGRITLPLSDKVTSVTGIDASQEMIERARTKTNSPKSNVNFVLADITNVRLDQKFDLIILPFRVFQALEHDAQVDGLFETIRHHLAPNGLAIINTFKPNMTRTEMVANWIRPEPTFVSERPWKSQGTVKHYDLRGELNAETMVLYPTLIYRFFNQDDNLLSEFNQQISMRCYWEDDLKDTVTSRDFEIQQTWGGYNGEAYGKGNELIIAFSLPLMEHQ